MKTVFSVLLITKTFSTCYSQLNFENITLDEAIKKANKTGKIIMANYVSDTCKYCDEIADANFSLKSLNTFILQKCIPIKISLNSNDRQKFIDDYNPDKKIGIYFISNEGELIHTFPGVLDKDMPVESRVNFYTFQINQAYSNLAEGRATLKELDEEWEKNPKNIEAMELNLTRRFSLRLKTDSLLDEYVRRIPEDSLKSERTILFIIKLAPNLFSKANEATRNNPLFNKIWYTMDLATRVAINSRITSSSMKVAISQKDREKAIRVAKFSFNTVTNSKDLAGRTYYKQLLNYFIGIKDTTNSLSLYSYYIKNYFLTISSDSLMVLVKQKENEFRNHVIAHHSDTALLNDTSLKKMFFNEIMQFQASVLNNAAWFIYTTSNNQTYLTDAINFAEKSNNVFESFSSLDTYARLLYKAGNAKKAIEVEQKAILLIEREKLDFSNFLIVLEKMKKGEPI